MPTAKATLADYVLLLSRCQAETHRAEDRPLYEKYLADAAVMLALLERGADASELRGRVADHERLLAQTWLMGPEHETVYGAWAKFKALL